MSTFFEGDFEMVKRLFFALYSFVRRWHEIKKNMKVLIEIENMKK